MINKNIAREIIPQNFAQNKCLSADASFASLKNVIISSIKF